MGAAEIEMLLAELAVNGHVSASTQDQAFSALQFLYQTVLGIELPRIDWQSLNLRYFVPSGARPSFTSFRRSRYLS